MSTHLRHWRTLLLSALALLALLGTIVPATGARAVGNVDWFGWGVNVDFQHSTWKVRYVTYLGSNLPTPHVVAEDVEDISAQCTEEGSSNLSYPTADSAYFDGNVYIQCALPSVRGALANLGYTPPSGDQPFCPCTLGGGPFWVDGQVRQLSGTGSMPFLDASDRGVRVNLLLDGTKVRTKLEVTRTQPPGGFISYASPEWTIDSAGNRTLMGWDGDGIVAVADHFGWLNYLTDTDPGWRSFFKADVSGNTIGYWNESPTMTMSGTSNINGDYRIGMNGGTLYIGYSPSTGRYLTGEIKNGGADPGCSGA
ncbi:MAG: hypothetical protein HGA45_20185 [Chloroflexales bacterium]|nr:hypothetical protein [Chloroflexales bacterium]